MLIIRKHYLREFFKVLTLIAAGLALIFNLLDLIDKIDDFLPYKPSIKALCFMWFSISPGIFSIFSRWQFFFAICLLSVRQRREEITTIKAAGGRLRTLFMPFYAAA